ncbi:MAG TPA: FlgD immunoglobulin-like domain containing protein [Candidatus Krumholzibacteria bacterium]
MRRITTVTCLVILLSVFLSSPSTATLRHLSSGLLNVEADSLKAFAADRAGNLFLVVWRPAPPRYTVVKLDADQLVVWELPVQIGWDTRIAMSATGDGGVVLAGGFRGTADFGGGPMTAYGSFTAYDVFIVKLSPDGAVRWQSRHGWDGAQSARDVAVDGNGDIIVTGTLAGVVNFGNLQLRGRGVDGFLLKLGGDGEAVWAQTVGGIGSQQGLAVRVDHENRIGLAIRIQSGAIGLGNAFYYHAGEADVMLAVYDGNGAVRWSRQAATPRWEEATDITFDADDNLLACGVMADSLNLGGATLPAPGPSGAEFLASYDSLGVHRWSTTRTDYGVRGSSLGMDAGGNSWFLAGGQRDDIWRSLPDQLTLVATDAAGGPIVSRLLGDVQAVAHMDADRVQVMCAQQAAVDFGGGAVPVVSPRRLSMATYSLREMHVSIDSLEARSSEDGVELHWDVVSTEPLGSYYLSRRIDRSGLVLLHTGAAATGPMSFIDTGTQPGHVHTYRIVVATDAGAEVYSDDVSISVPGAAPTPASLEQNAPNPFNPLTTFGYSLSAPAHVTIVIYDTRGAVVARLEQGTQPAGRHTASWGGHNMRGEFVASGVYYYRLEGVPGVGARKMLLLK